MGDEEAPEPGDEPHSLPSPVLLPGVVAPAPPPTGRRVEFLAFDDYDDLPMENPDLHMQEDGWM